MQKLSDAEVYKIIKRTFKHFSFISRNNVKRNWNVLTQQERMAALRSARYIDDISEAPEKYFSRAATQRQWRRRGTEYAKRYGLNPRVATYYIVQDPTGCVMSRAEWAFINNSDVNRLFYQFCAAVQNWEYGKTSKSVAGRAGVHSAVQKIIELSDKIRAIADIVSRDAFSRSMNVMVKEQKKQQKQR